MLRSTTTFHANGRTVVAGSILAATDPIVKGREALFEPVGVTDRTVEQATAEPGKKRSTRRGRTSGDG